MKPNIYYGGAISEADEESRRVAKATIAMLQKHGTVLTEHLGYDDPRAFDDKNLQNGANICQRDTAWQNDSDVVVLNISRASTGTGDENMYNLGVRGNPVLALYREGIRASPMVTQRKHPLLTVETYANDHELEQKIGAFMAKYKSAFTLYPNLIMFDAIDGAGKGAIYETFKEWGERQKMRLFDSVEYWKHANKMPTWADVNKMLGGCELVLTAEPTYEGIGKVIREEIIKKDNPRPWSAQSTAQAYSLNREHLYKLLVRDALESGAVVASDRSVVTSQHYQTIQAEHFQGYDREFFLGYVNGLAGNQYALQHIPGLLILPKVSVDVTQSRLDARKDKSDNVRFEARDFQEKLNAFYQSGRVASYYARRGTQVVELDMAKCPTRDDTKREALRIWSDYRAEKKS